MTGMRRCISLSLLVVLTAWASGCANGQDDVQVQNDVEYGTVGKVRLLLDIYRPAGSGYKIRPAVLLIHGGGWGGGDKKEFRSLAMDLAKAGYICFSINYRLTSGGYRYPAQLDDAQRAVRWIRRYDWKYDLDASRVAALGSSAGGHLAALLGTRDTRDNSDPLLAKYSSRVTCVVDLYGPMDFTAKECPPLCAPYYPAVVSFLGKPPEKDPSLYREVSPIKQIDRKTGPFLIMHGTADTVVPLEQSQRMADALREEGIYVLFLKTEGENHGFDQKGSKERYLEDITRFLNRYLQPGR